MLARNTIYLIPNKLVYKFNPKNNTVVQDIYEDLQVVKFFLSHG